MIAPHFRRVLATPVALVFVFCVACGNSSPATSGNRTLIVEKVFTIDSMDPARGVSSTAILVDSSVYDKLLYVNPHDLSKPYPDLATSFTASADGTTYTFKLRQGVKFASGNPFTSADVVFSLTRLAGIKSTPAALMSGLTVTAPDPYTVVISAKTPTPAIPVEMTQYNSVILDSKLLQQNGGSTDTTDKAEAFLNGPNMAGSGPYYIQSVDLTSQFVLKANPNYWGTKPAYSTVIVRNVPPATQSLDIQDGQAGLALDISQQAAAGLNSSVNVVTAPTLDQGLLYMSADAPLTSNQDFRDAVKLGIDYQGLLSLVGKGTIQSAGFVPVGTLGALPSSDAPTRDVNAAKAALAKVGVTNPTFTITYATDINTDGVLLSTLGAKIQSDLKEVGITVILKGQPISVVLPAVEAGKVQAWLNVNSADYPDPSDFLFLAPGSYMAGWFHWITGMDPAIDPLFTAASTAIQPADRDAAYKALAQAMNTKGYALFLFQPGRALVEAKSVHADVNVFTFVDLGSVT